jgi:S-adenosylmethionine decarboxylase
MRDLAPEIVRQRLLIEGLYQREITRADVERYLVDVAAHLPSMRRPRSISRAPISRRPKSNRARSDATTSR